MLKFKDMKSLTERHISKWIKETNKIEDGKIEQVTEILKQVNNKNDLKEILKDLKAIETRINSLIKEL